ncbi:MAG: S8 family serine peptidase, partial [Candidatus Tenebribacter mawsonii]|nr:S8 family serine peptidase [Candidatus Tenebribacter mawsonii]
MKKTIILSLLLVVLSSLTIFGQIGSNAISIIETDSNYVKGEILIKFKSIPSNKKAVVAAKQQLISKYKSKVVKQWRTGAEHWKVDTLLPGYNLIKIIDSLNTNPYVEYAEPNYILRADIIPNDPSFGDQWALNNTGQNDGTPDADIDAPESWDITTGDTNIVVGVIDSGIDYEHEDLEDNIWTNWDEIPDNGIDDDNNGYIDDIHGWDFYNNDDDPMDDFGHGTHVAGTIGAVSNNGIGVTGVAWDVRMMALKFLGSDGSGPTSGAVSAIIYGTANGVKLTNNSWGGGEYSQTLYDAIASADTAGILFIASAGNDAKDNDANPTYPSCYDLENIISIASTDRNDSLSTFSNWGLSTVDIAAPGSSILSTEPNNQYGYKSGTSMAAPNVSGGIVLAWAQFPGFSSHQIIHQILGGSDQKENLDGLMNSGSRLNIYNAVVDTNISIKVNHREIEFGALLLGNQSEENEILISNMQDDQILIDSIICDTGFLITRNSTFTNFIPSFSINPNQVDTITVVFNPTIEGYFNKTCKIYYSTSGLISRTVTVFLSGYCAGNGTIINAGTVSGIWEKALSPYIINGNISIEASNTLSIEPGVNVLFAGYYKVVVSDNSTLIANGSENDSIYFQAIDPVEGWAGMDLISKQNMDSLSYCVFKNGKAQNIIDQSWPPNYNGGVISITHSSPFISDCSFKNNNAPVGFGGAIYIYGNSYPVLTQLEFFNNTAPYGGAIAICGTSFDETYRILNNIVFIDNTAAYGGALYNQQGNLIINNLTFYSNNAYYGGGAICLWSDSDVLLKNSILYGNTSPDGSEIKFGSYMVPSSLFIEYCNIDTTNSDWYSHDSTYSDLDVFQMGDGNIYSNPLFVNINNNNLSISTNSPCIDAGNPNDNVAEEPFPNGYRINMGFNGGTINATGTTDPGLANIPNPLDFEILSPNETKQLPLFVKNGSPITIHISDISLSDTSNFKISTNYIIPDTLSSGQVDSVMIDFTSSINVDSLYQISITINTIETPDYIIPAEANILIGTNVISNNVSGIWTEEGSPYNIFNDISVETNDSLKIEPGVTVRFMGKYNFRIAESSRLLAQGTQALPIYFTAFDTINGWYGIDIVNSGNDDIFEYCNMSRGNVNGTSPNDRGGALFISNSDPLIKHSIIEHNAGNYAAAVYLFYSEAEFNDVIIRNNTCSDMGVIEILFSENVLFENCTIYNNYSDAQGGAFGIFQNSDINILNSLIFNNTGTTYGGGISIQSSSCSLINVSMVNNLTGYRGNEIHLMNGSHVDIINSIIYNNCNNINPASGELFNDIYLDSYSNPTQNTLNISYSNIDTLKSNWVGSQAPINGLITWGDGNTTLNPQFTDINNWNFKLDSISPCIDAGINDSVFSLTDIDGNLRIWDGNNNDTATVDMGAYEYGSPLAHFQEIELNQGWNIFSGNITPVDMNMLNIINSLIDSS